MANCRRGALLWLDVEDDERLEAHAVCFGDASADRWLRRCSMPAEEALGAAMRGIGIWGAYFRPPGVGHLAVAIGVMDAVNAVIGSTFTLYARDAGLSVGVIGILTAVVGATRVATAVPMGKLSDVLGRRGVLVPGMILMGFGAAALTVEDSGWWFLTGRILLGLGTVSTFSIGLAYIADHVERQRRNVAVGLYVMAQGAGFAVGPALASALLHLADVAIIYRLLAVVCVLTATYCWRTMLSRRPRTGTAGVRSSVPNKALDRGIAGRRELWGVCVANFGMLWMFSGSVLPFLALVAADNGLTLTGVTLLYSLRATVSTLVRLPIMAMLKRVQAWTVVITAIVADAIAAGMYGISIGLLVLVAAAVIDGTALGMYLFASQAFLVELFGQRSLGSVVGLYSMTGGIGATLGAVAMGEVAAHIGSQGLFRLDALFLVGVCCVCVVVVPNRKTIGQPPAAA